MPVDSTGKPSKVQTVVTQHPSEVPRGLLAPTGGTHTAVVSGPLSLTPTQAARAAVCPLLLADSVSALPLS